MSPSRQITIKYFAKLGDDLGCSQETFELSSDSDLLSIKSQLLARGEPWSVLAAPEIRCAVNQTLCKGNVALQSGDEIAFFPPVTGG